jgi:hypothetical protein
MKQHLNTDDLIKSFCDRVDVSLPNTLDDMSGLLQRMKAVGMVTDQEATHYMEEMERESVVKPGGIRGR